VDVCPRHMVVANCEIERHLIAKDTKRTQRDPAPTAVRIMGRCLGFDHLPCTLSTSLCPNDQ